ncbi:MAG TPA: rod shape-determining protein MreC [Holophagaceae bacterium]|nr:rod shape-determining protein MreC [Holophagaceae bacterium]
MAARPSNWGWTPTGRRRYALLALWLGHGAWVLLGRVPGRAWSQVSTTLAHPFQRMATGFHDWRVTRAQRVADLEHAQLELTLLRQELADRQTEAARLAPLHSEAEEAKRLLGLKVQVPLDLQGARILSSTRPGAFGGLVLEGGTDRGWVPDQGVIAPEGVVGRIWSVAPTQSLILPADAPNAAIGVMLTRSRATGVLQGLGDGRAEIRYVNPQEVVQPGEAVHTSGLDRVFPRGLLVGYVTEVKPTELELKVRVQLAAPLDRLRLVLLLPPEPPLEVQPTLRPPTKADTRPTAKPKAAH